MRQRRKGWGEEGKQEKDSMGRCAEVLRTARKQAK